MIETHEQMVRECAYYLWIDAGRMDGLAHEHWIAAERTVAYRGGLSHQAAPFDGLAAPFDGLSEPVEAAPRKKAAKSVKPTQRSDKAGAASAKTAKSGSAAGLAGKVVAKSAGKAAAKGQSYGATTH